MAFPPGSARGGVWFHCTSGEPESARRNGSRPGAICPTSARRYPSGRCAPAARIAHRPVTPSICKVIPFRADAPRLPGSHPRPVAPGICKNHSAPFASARHPGVPHRAKKSPPIRGRIGGGSSRKRHSLCAWGCAMPDGNSAAHPFIPEGEAGARKPAARQGGRPPDGGCNRSWDHHSTWSKRMSRK